MPESHDSHRSRRKPKIRHILKKVNKKAASGGTGIVPIGANSERGIPQFKPLGAAEPSPHTLTSLGAAEPSPHTLTSLGAAEPRPHEPGGEQDEEFARIPTGIMGLDELIEGGFVN